ncbi:hypothetical protein IWQ49_003650 [Labrenzia sp. EL_126]|nr:hypothetical protein [Labrenzia sp. EL_126]
MMRDQLQQILASWDGKATTPLQEAYEIFRGEPAFLDLLIEFSGSKASQRGATWLLKHHFDRKGSKLTDDQSERHLAGLSCFSDWEAKLHFLQYLEHLKLSEKAEEPLRSLIDPELGSENKFLRAWAHYALAIHANRFPAHKEYAFRKLTTARECETAGAVKVRIRKALEKLGR